MFNRVLRLKHLLHDVCVPAARDYGMTMASTEPKLLAANSGKPSYPGIS